jgi:hypothetical protein
MKDMKPRLVVWTRHISCTGNGKFDNIWPETLKGRENLEELVVYKKIKFSLSLIIKHYAAKT